MNEKKIKGQYYTVEHTWLKPQVQSFIENARREIIYDPFAGNGDIFKPFQNYKKKGLDIDSSLGWEINDSLVQIPKVSNSIIITNPPYFSNYSASRKKVFNEVEKYFSNSIYDDLYLIALEKMLKANDKVVAIVPETFINSNFQYKNLLHSITILEESLFLDTDAPVCVLCFDGEQKDFNEVEVYKNETYLNTLEYFLNIKIKPMKKISIKFNCQNGWLALRAVDTTSPEDMIRFDDKNKINYNWGDNIKTSSRLLTLIDIDISDNLQQALINEANKILFAYRKETDDVLLSPFKGNMKNGRRRRRLDYTTARAILELAYLKITGEKIYEQLRII
ncbi:MAG: Eco57I restriction-modification methylase domain-containing protein [Christensenellales bacterium]